MDRESVSGSFEACADELNDFIGTLEHYPHTVLALALRAHLSGLLQALLRHDRCTPAQVRAFLEQMEHETLPAEPD